MSRNSFVVPARPNRDSRSLTTIILSGSTINKGKSYGAKSLLKIDDRELLLDYQIKMIKEVFIDSDILVTVGYQADRVINHVNNQIKIIENQLYETTSQVEELRLALNITLTDHILIINGDCMFNKASLTGISLGTTSLLVDTVLSGNRVGVNTSEGYAQILAYGIHPEWAEILYVSGNDLKVLRKLCKNRDYSKLCLYEIVNKLIEKRGPIMALEPLNTSTKKVITSENTNS